MPEQIYIGNFAKGLKLDRLAFNIDNDAFPTMFNFYSWRGRAKRKRGTLLLGQLQRQLSSLTVGTLDGSGNISVNLITLFSLGATASITPGSIVLSDGTNTFVEATPPNGTLIGAPAGIGTINYASGALTITGGMPGGILLISFSYFPGLPVMGLRDFTSALSQSLFPLLIAFDTKYAYQINQAGSSEFFYSVSYYKASNNPVVWSGQDYQQFWTTNYPGSPSPTFNGALWTTNNKPGLQIETIMTITVGNPTTITTGSPHGLISGDWVWFNEITGTDAGLLNGQAFQITVTSPTQFTVAVDTTGKVLNNNGIFQTLTATPIGSTGDGIRWYDGDPTGGTGLPTGTGLGWVNFAPPLTGAASVKIDTAPAALYYLVGAQIIVPFKDRLLFFSPWIQASGGSPIQLQDTVIWSWNGTPFYNALVPTGQTFDVTAYYVDQTGKGGYLSAGISQPIASAIPNEDVLIVGFSNKQTRFVYTGNDLYPFLFFNINSELGTASTFSAVTLDRGAISIGYRGIIETTQQSAERIDLDIPDSVFQIQKLNHGTNRVNSIRDYFNEWIFFSYPTGDGMTLSGSWRFPSSSFMWNYRDNTWAIMRENFTAQGTYRRERHYTWATLPFKTWAEWQEPWNSGSSSALFPSVVGGNPQGYVLIKDQGTGESISGTIQAIGNDGANTQITSIDHCVNIGDYLLVTGALGTTSINNQIGLVINTADANTFTIDLPFPMGTYLGLGKFTRLSQPLLQTKQFAEYWPDGRKCRLCVQKYLMEKTTDGQVTVNIYLSQDPNNAWNDPTNTPFVPEDSLIYTQLLFTCPESTNIGLTPANVNLQMPTGGNQLQIWHRLNTSLIGDSVQIGITLSDAQMRNLEFATSEITLHGVVLAVERGPQLA